MIGDILQPTHLLFIFVVALLVLGPKRLPEVGRQLGNGLRDFRAAINGDRSEHRDEVEQADTEIDSQWEPGGDFAGDHEFAHEATTSVPDEHRVGADAPTGAGTEASAASGAGHEFAASEAGAGETRSDSRT